MLGHFDASFTLRTYTHVTRQMQESAAEKMGNFMSQVMCKSKEKTQSVGEDTLTSDLAPYLFRTKTDDNKMSHLLYVALTRSKDHLTILISQNVESTFSRDFVLAFFAQYSASVRQIQ